MPDTVQDSTRVQGNLPCEECGSSDAVSLYSDGHKFCFSCSHLERGEDSEEDQTQPPKEKPKDLLSGSYHAIPSRKITKETCLKWDVPLVTTKDGRQALAYRYDDATNNKVAQKIRYANKKDFNFIGKPKKAMLYGWRLWKGGKKLVLTEGEMDALTVSQVQNHKWPVMSLINGASSVKDLVDYREQLESRFDEIIIMFDMDEPGREAAQRAAQIFTPGKAKIAELPCKDANECLQEGKAQDIITAIWNAQPYRPDGIVTISDVLPKIGLKPTTGRPLPWDKLTDLTYGIKSPAVWVWTSGSGMGKTEFFKDMVATNIHNKVKSGVIFLEEETQDTVVDIAGKLVGKCFNSPGVEYDPQERTDAIQQLQDSECLYLYDHFGHDDYEAIRSVIRHMVLAYGCEVIFLDHITAFTDGLGFEANALAEKMMKELSSLTRELKFNLQVISHVRKSDSSRTPAEEGGRVKIDDLKGSGAVKQWANFVIALERNQQAKCRKESRTTTVRILKARGVGKNVGKTFKVLYDPATATLVEATAEDLEKEEEEASDNPFAI